MPTRARFAPSTIGNKIKREEVAAKARKAKAKAKLERRIEQAKLESKNPALKKKRQAENVPRTLDNTREYDPTSMLTADPSASTSANGGTEMTDEQRQRDAEEIEATFANDPFASYFSPDRDPTVPPRILITTSPKASKPTFTFCDVLCSVFPGGKYIRRKAGKGFELGNIASWAGKREWDVLMVVNENHGKPNALTVVNLPEGPTAYFKLTSVLMSKSIQGHAKATDHSPELVLNGFTTRLGHTIGRLFQTLWPPLPEFQGRQVVTIHCQRDFLFFRRHRYAFRSTSKVALQEIGPRFTLKLRWLKKSIPAVQRFGEAPPRDEEEEQDASEDKGENTSEKEGQDEEVEGLDVSQGDVDMEDNDNIITSVDFEDVPPGPTQQEVTPAPKPEKNQTYVRPPKQDEFIWAWKPELETTRRTFFL